MSLLKSLFGKEPTIGKPERDEPDWDETINAYPPADDCIATGMDDDS